MKHNQKIKLAKKLQTKQEMKTPGLGIFDSALWKKRKESIVKRVMRQESVRKAYKS